jgi:hypothetical protein
LSVVSACALIRVLYNECKILASYQCTDYISVRRCYEPIKQQSREVQLFIKYINSEEYVYFVYVLYVVGDDLRSMFPIPIAARQSESAKSQV